jgi:RNA polymerase sigma-70 factor (ECF subfamily)
MASPLGVTHAPTLAETFEVLYRSHYGGLCDLVYGYVGSRDTARELVQDLFLTVWDNVSTGGAPVPGAPYLYTAARNRALRSLRHGKVEAQYEARQSQAVDDRPCEAENAVVEQELSDAAAAAMRELPERCRLVFSMSRHEHLPNAEIAARLGISVSTVEQQMWRALKALRAKLGPYLLVLTGAITLLK